MSIKVIDLHAALSRNSAFCALHPEIVARLIEHASLHESHRAQTIAPAGEPFPYIGITCSGTICVTLNARGPYRGVARLDLYEAKAGEMFGEIAFLAASAPPGDIITGSKHAAYALLPTRAIESVFEEDAALLRRFAAQAAARVYAVAQRMHLFHGGWSTVARVANVLLAYCDDGEVLQPAHAELGELTQREIAAAAGCAKETAARAIGLLESRGALRRQHGHIRLLNRDMLTKYAHGTQKDLR